MNDLIKCAIIDDEQLAIDTLKWQIEEFCQGYQVVYTHTNPEKAYNELKTNTIDICFLDIDMPELSGFDFLKLWNNNPPFDVIFTTAYSEYAIQAFRVSALDYLLKPIDEEELVQTLEKYTTKRNSSNFSNQMSLLIEQLNHKDTYPRRIGVPTTEGIHMIDVQSIQRLEAFNNYTTIHMDENRKIVVSKTLKEMEKALDPGIFIRIHQSHTININLIQLYQRGRGGNVTLQDGSILPVSKNRKEALLERLGF